MSLKDSLSRLFGGRENRILRLLKDYLDSIFRVVNELKTLLSMVMGKEAFSSPSVLDTKIEMISVYESLADDLHLESLLKICNGSFFSGLREDFIRLFDSMDDIADSAKESSQIISRSGIGKALRKYSAFLKRPANRPVRIPRTNAAENPKNTLQRVLAISIRKDGLARMETVSVIVTHVGGIIKAPSKIEAASHTEKRKRIPKSVKPVLLVFIMLKISVNV